MWQRDTMKPLSKCFMAHDLPVDCNRGNRRRIGHFGSGITHDMKICSDVFINIPVNGRFATFRGTIGFFVSIKNVISNDQIFKN